MLKSYRSIDCSIVVLTSWMCRIASVRDILSRVRPLTSSISSPTSRLSRSDGEPYNLILPSAFSTRMITYPESSTTCCCNYEKERDNHMNRKRQKKRKTIPNTKSMILLCLSVKLPLWNPFINFSGFFGLIKSFA